MAKPPKQPSKTYIVVSVTLAFVALIVWAVWYFPMVLGK